MNMKASIARQFNIYAAILLIVILIFSWAISEHIIVSEREKVISKIGHKLIESSKMWRDEIIARKLLHHDGAIELFEKDTIVNEELSLIHLFDSIYEYNAFSVPCRPNDSGYCFDPETGSIYSAYYLSYGDEDYGVLVKTKQIESSTLWGRYLISVIVISALLFILLFVVLWLYINKYLITPYNKVIESLKPIAEGKFDITLPMPQNRETQLLVGNITKLIHDIKSYQELSHKNAKFAAVGQISSHIAHDMRSPLSVLEAYVKSESKTSDPEEKEFHTAAARSVKKLIHMADDLVNHAKAAKVERMVVDLNKFVADAVIVETRSRSLEENVKIRFAADDNIYANIDAYKMGRVMVNLVNNAIQAISRDQGEIAISAKVADGDTLIVEVIDNGKGIEKEHMPHIFDSFYTVGKVKGIGLGLSYCKQVVESHGGTIDVESEAGKGAKFTIKIPNCIVRDFNPSIESKKANIDYIGRRFLVVDDDEDIRRNWRRIIENNGGIVAWEAVSSNDIIKGDGVDAMSIDAAIVDYNFPDSVLTGVDVIKHLRSRGIKEIHLCTGYSDNEEIREAALSAGATSVMGKELCIT